VEHEEQRLNRRGSTVLFALLLTFLLGGGPAAAFADTTPAAVKQLQPGKAAGLVRALRRACDDDAGDSDTTLFRPAGDPSIETLLVSVRPAGEGAAAPAVARAESRRAPFHARAPPAA
jgi:hypothetical protein